LGLADYTSGIMTRATESKATIKIPRQLYNRLKSIISDTGFDSVTDFVVYVLRDIAAGAAESRVQGDQPDAGQGQLSGEEIRMVRERLKRLGYL
jgi:Arc/MetJ-type ribon-helix-helix transcriptional regulator